MELRDRIADERARTAARIAGLEQELAGIVDGSDLVAVDDEHDPEGSTIAFERSQVSALLRAARTRLSALDVAMVAVDEPGFGVCASCGEQIGVERLMAVPETRLCLRCAARSTQRR